MSDHAITMSAVHTSEREYTITIVLRDMPGDEYYAQGKAAFALLTGFAGVVTAAVFTMDAGDGDPADRLIDRMGELCK
jgi:hypothetical protein